MDERPARLRRANEWAAWNADPEGGAVTLRCECGHERCAETIAVTPEEFDHARSRRARLVVAEHAGVAGAAVLERRERYALIAEAAP